MADYSAPTAVANFNPGEELLPVSQEGVHQYCVIPGNSETANDPEVIQVLIDNTSPTLKPEVRIVPNRKEIYIEPIFRMPEYADYFLAYGPRNSLECATARYKRYQSIPLLAPNVQTKVCLYGFDLAGNRSRTFEYLYPTFLR
jgi:hypothetical protein